MAYADTQAFGTVQRRGRISPEIFMREHVFAAEPVILEAAFDWPALDRWSPEFFKREFASRTVSVDDDELTVPEFIDRVVAGSESNPAPYLVGTGEGNYLRDIFPELLGDIAPRPAYLAPNWLEERFYPRNLSRLLNRGPNAEIYIGGVGSGFNLLHWDALYEHVFAFQIYGEKHWIVFPPSDSENVYPHEGHPNLSQINVFGGFDPQQFPRLADAHPRRLLLHAGDMLFLPGGWWHTTHIDGPSISVSINAANASNWSQLVTTLCKGGGLARAAVFGASLTAFRIGKMLRGA